MSVFIRSQIVGSNPNGATAKVPSRNGGGTFAFSAIRSLFSSAEDLGPAHWSGCLPRVQLQNEAGAAQKPVAFAILGPQTRLSNIGNGLH